MLSFTILVLSIKFFLTTYYPLYDTYAIKSNSTAHIRNAVFIGEASLRRRMISFICDVCDVNRETYDPGAPGGLYLAHFDQTVLKLSWS